MIFDFVILAYTGGAIFILIVLVLLTNFIISIINVVRQRRIIALFFSDDVTTGHNWVWFTVKGEKLLHSRFNAKNDYAIVNLHFINYRNYCLCHSVKDGEKLLQKIYEELRKNMAKKELCVHASSSSFALILRYTGEEELRGRVQDIIKKLEHIETGHKFSFHAGINFVNKAVDKNGRPVLRKNISIEDEYNNACSARATLDENDDSGTAVFDDKLLEDERWLDTVQDNQEKAVRNEEFVVYYQPKYDPRTDELRGAEALIRWNSPEFGFVAPYKFIPIFEKNGFITEIDHYMLNHVARDQKKWLDQGYKCVPVSVNVSRAHFVENDLAEQIRDIVDDAGTPHNLIEIELTESAFFDDKNAMIETINKLKSYGFAVSMDDFGSGYSSLNSLKDMPLDVLKLDAEFFRGESEDGRGEIVVSEAIKLAKSLNMRTVAEGVEERDQVDFLAKEGCDMIQGYYYAKPMPGNEYEGKMVM